MNFYAMNPQQTGSQSTNLSMGLPASSNLNFHLDNQIKIKTARHHPKNTYIKHERPLMTGWKKTTFGRLQSTGAWSASENGTVARIWIR